MIPYTGVCVSFLEKWKKFLKEEDWEGAESILHCPENFKPTSELATDVMEI